MRLLILQLKHYSFFFFFLRETPNFVHRKEWSLLAFQTSLGIVI